LSAPGAAEPRDAARRGRSAPRVADDAADPDSIDAVVERMN